MADGTTLPAHAVGRRGSADAVDPSAREQVRPLWISQDHRPAEVGRVASGQGSSAAHLAAGRVEGSRPSEPRGRLWLNDGSCIRLRPQHRNHVWSYDLVEAQTHDGRKVRLMTLIDEFTRECLAIRVARRINSLGVIETMADVMLVRGVPEHIRSDNGPEMTAKIVRHWLAQVGAKALYIEPGSP